MIGDWPRFIDEPAKIPVGETGIFAGYYVLPVNFD
jgi:hypothetical protein